MTKEQYKKCEEIFNLYRYSPFAYIQITISLGKIFNKEITEEKAKEIFNNIYKVVSSNPFVNFYHGFWDIANYLDNGTPDGYPPNYIIENGTNKWIPNYIKEKRGGIYKKWD